MNKFFIGFLVLFVGGFGTLGIVQAGLYPVAIVGSDIIWAKELNQATGAALTYYAKLGAQITPQVHKEVRRAVLDKITENVLILKDLKKEEGEGLEATLDEILKKYSTMPNLGPAAAQLYGLNLEEFYQMILIPQAQREILEKKLSAGGRKLDDWLAQEKQTASVILLLK